MERRLCNFVGNAISDEDSAFSIGDCANTTGLKTIHLYSYIKKKKVVGTPLLLSKIIGI